MVVLGVVVLGVETDADAGSVAAAVSAVVAVRGVLLVVVVVARVLSLDGKPAPALILASNAFIRDNFASFIFLIICVAR